MRKSPLLLWTVLKMEIARLKSEEELEALLSKDAEQLVILKFSAEWCAPCKTLHPIFCALAQELDANNYESVTFAEVDRDDLEEAFEQYSITKLPTVIGIVNKQAVLTLQRPSDTELRHAVQQNLPAPTLTLDADF